VTTDWLSFEKKPASAGFFVGGIWKCVWVESVRREEYGTYEIKHHLKPQVSPKKTNP